MASIEFLRALCDRSFFHFVKLVGGFVEQGGCISEHIHKPLCDFFQDQTIKRKAIFEPRNWLKSTVFTEWGTVWNYLQNNNVRTLIASQNEDIACRFQWFIQHQVLNNTVLRKLYPELQVLDQAYTKRNRWSQKYADLPRGIPYKEASITSIGVGGAAQSGHYDFLFIDDPVGQKHIDSPVELERVMRWHDNTKELLDNPNYMSPDGSTIQLICTFWGPGDYGTYVLEKYPEFKWMIVPCLKDEALEDTDNVKWLQDPDANHMESNWEGAPGGKSTTKYYLDMMANPEQDAIFWAQHMNNPKRASGLNKFDYAWLKFYHLEERDEGYCLVCNDDEEVFVLKDIPLYGMIDPGGFAETKLSKAGSRNAILIGGQPQNSLKKFVTYTWAGKLKAPEHFLDQVFKAHKQQNPRMWRIETVGAQQYIYKDIVEARRKRGIALPISPMPPDVRKGCKDDDIQAVINPMFNGEIYIHSAMKELIGEVKNYPHGLTVDLIDMLGKINKLYWSRKKREETSTSNEDMYYEIIRGRNAVTGY